MFQTIKQLMAGMQTETPRHGIAKRFQSPQIDESEWSMLIILKRRTQCETRRINSKQFSFTTDDNRWCDPKSQAGCVRGKPGDQLVASVHNYGFGR
jgi:hypothetical protein